MGVSKIRGLPLESLWEFPRLGAYLWSPENKDHNIFGADFALLLEAPIWSNYTEGM